MLAVQALVASGEDLPDVMLVPFGEGGDGKSFFLDRLSGARVAPSTAGARPQQQPSGRATATGTRSSRLQSAVRMNAVGSSSQKANEASVAREAMRHAIGMASLLECVLD